MSISNDFKIWIKNVQELTSKKVNNKVCPNCSKGNIEYIYIGDKNEKIGYLQAWCNVCRKGIYCSRVKIPDGVDIISYDDKDNIKLKAIPVYEQIMP